MQNRRKAFTIAGLVAGLVMAVTAHASALPAAALADTQGAARAPLQLALKVRTSTTRPDPCKNARFTKKYRDACYAELEARQRRVRFNPCADAGAGRGYTYGCETGAPPRSTKPAAPPVRDKDKPTGDTSGRTPVR